MNDPIDQLKREDEAKRDAHWGKAERWRLLQEAMGWVASLPWIERNTPAKCRELERAKLAHWQ